MTVANWLDSGSGQAPPPDWWLQRLYDFDPMLVMFGSLRTNGSYLLARRRQFTAGLGDVAMLDNKHPDTNFCYRHGVLPINMPLRPTGPNPWTEQTIAFVIEQLKARDLWAVTGGSQDVDKVKRLQDTVDETDAAVKRKERRNLKDTFRHMGRDAWRSMQARIGTRNKRASDFHGVARPKPASGGSAQ